MKILIVENKKSKKIEFPVSVLPKWFLIDEGEKETAFGIAKKINEYSQQWGMTLILINIELKNRKYTPKKLWGIEIAEEIRTCNHFLERTNQVQLVPILLFGPHSEEHIIKKVATLNNDLKRIGFFEKLGIQYWNRKFPFSTLNEKTFDPIPNRNALESYFEENKPSFSSAHHAYSNFNAAINLVEDLYQLEKNPQLRQWWEQFQNVKSATFRYAKFLKSFPKTTKPSTINIRVLRKKWKVYKRHIATFPKDRAIILIDDQALNIHGETTVGWKELYAYLLFGKPTGIKVIDANQSESEILKAYNSNKSCLILDFYLSAMDYNKAVEDSKAGHILKKIKEQNKYAPVMVATASNKAWSKDDFKALGCEGYWIKPGLESQLEKKPTLEKMMEFAGTISLVVQKEYYFLYQAYHLIRSMKKSSLWWETYKWKKHRHNFLAVKVNKEALLTDLEEILSKTNDYYFEYQKAIKEVHTSQAAHIVIGIISDVGQWLEKIHGENQREFSRIMYARKDYLGKALYQMRNKSQHKQRTFDNQFEHLYQFLKGFLCYLWFSPSEVISVLNGTEPKKLSTFFKGNTELNRMYFDYFNGSISLNQI